jgi:hypothetical protein
MFVRSASLLSAILYASISLAQVSTAPPPGNDIFASANPAPDDILNTPVGPVRRACTHLIPAGATIHDADGTVSLNGSVIAQYAACPNVAPHALPGGGFDAGYQNVAWTQASVSNATEEFENMSVPALPTTPVSGEQLFLWQGIEFANGDILQPMLTYVTNDFDTACPGGANDCYEVNAFFYGNKSNLVYYTPAYLASPGDMIQTGEETVSSTEWVMWSEDLTSNIEAFAYADEAAPSGSATMIANSAEIYSFSNCNALPNVLEYTYWDNRVFTGSAWNTYTLTTLSYTNYSDWTSSFSVPNCSYSAGHSPNGTDSAAYIYWSP